ncbi:MAG: response regulator transcription factor [Proteobacteria bacterium]|nr:response regulator transcription factor [Pseudomonadota bacterium]
MAWAIDFPLPIFAPIPPGGKLTLREEEVLQLVSLGLTNAEIGQVLELSPHTVKTHLDNILNKLGLYNRTQAAVWAAKHGRV